MRSDFINYNVETGICRINLNNVSNQANDGFYMIKAINDAGSLTTICKVKVHLKSFPVLILEHNSGPDFIIKLMPEVRVMDGEEVCMTCVCSALPSPEINWLRSNHQNPDKFEPVILTNDLRVSYDSTTGKCTLKIFDTYPQDGGIFICVASNMYGDAETRTKLIVDCMF